MANEIEFKVKITDAEITKFFSDDVMWRDYGLVLGEAGLRNDFYYRDASIKLPYSEYIKLGKMIRRIREDGIYSGDNPVKFLLSRDFNPHQKGILKPVTYYTEKVKRTTSDGFEKNDEYEVTGDNAAPKIAEIKNTKLYSCWFNKQKKYIRVCLRMNEDVHIEFVNVSGHKYLEVENTGTAASEYIRLEIIKELVKNLGFDLNKIDSRNWVEIINS